MVIVKRLQIRDGENKINPNISKLVGTGSGCIWPNAATVSEALNRFRSEICASVYESDKQTGVGAMLLKLFPENDNQDHALVL